MYQHHPRQDFLPAIPDVILEDYIHTMPSENRTMISAEQAIMKTSLDLPHLSLLEKNSTNYIHV